MAPVHYRTCHFCDAMCGLVLETDGARVTSVRGDPDDVFSRGHLCPKGAAMGELHDDPDRLRSPVKRVGERFVPVSWDEALDEAASRLEAVGRLHGRDAVASYGGNPMAHNHGGALGYQLLLASLGTRNRFDANSQDSNPKIFAAMQMYGDGLSITVPDVDRAQYVLMLGANPAASMGSQMTLGDVRARLKGVRERGGRMVLFDPRRTESASLCDEHHFVRPGGDAALLLALLRELFASRRIDRAALEKRARGARELEEIAQRFSPERVFERTGVAPEVVRRVAGELLSWPVSLVYARVGLCQNEHGVLASWLVEAINVVLGHFDRPGGMMFAKPAVDIGPIARLLLGNEFGRYRSRVRGLPELAGSLPSAALAEEIETEGAGQVRALVTFAGNPVLSLPNGERLGRALAKLECMVSVDMYLNATTRNAHFVLPPVSALETGHYDLLMHMVAVHNTVKYSEPTLPRSEGALDDYEILGELAARIASRRVTAGRASAGVLRSIERAARRARPTTEGILDALLRLGPYGDKYLPGRAGLTLAKVREAVHGIDLGPLEPAGRAKVHTRDGRVDLAPRVYLDALPAFEHWVDEKPAPLVLIGRRHLRSNNSWMHNLPSLVKGPDRTALLMHPRDAERLALQSGRRVRVHNRVGEVTVKLESTDAVMPGVVSLPHGFGHQRASSTMRVAGALNGVNVNALTDDAWVEPILGDSILNGVPVEVSPLDDDS